MLCRVAGGAGAGGGTGAIGGGKVSARLFELAGHAGRAEKRVHPVLTRKRDVRLESVRIEECHVRSILEVHSRKVFASRTANQDTLANVPC